MPATPLTVARSLPVDHRSFTSVHDELPTDRNQITLTTP